MIQIGNKQYVECPDCPRCKPKDTLRNSAKWGICGMSGNIVYLEPWKEKRIKGNGYINHHVSSCRIFVKNKLNNGERKRMIKIEPRKPTDRGGYITMPLKKNVPMPKESNWKLTICLKCGRECWSRPLPEGFTEDMFSGRLCTECAISTAVAAGDS